eukprot:TRINITY_DN784_c0_g1_i7.p2 TRINITY_DN784_c0_g1~~TRINITY_DN784_c0_g1_i7.p2  ORF type:complete len:104 (+),score=6.21 TRINITY_DN784_c0_g1_i7:134-445(+)
MNVELLIFLGTGFSLFKRKHQCRSCGKFHCGDCLNTFDISNLGVSGPKICKFCYPTYDKQSKAPAKGVVSPGKARICVVGFSASAHYTRYGSTWITKITCQGQ